MRVIWICS